MDLKKIEGLMKLMKKHSVHELSLDDKEAGNKITITGEAVLAPQALIATPAPAPIAVAPAAPAVTGATAAPEPAKAGSALAANQSMIKSPFVGTYYEASSPASDPFVKVGQKVEKGQVLCIVEAMKLMNEIEADASGTIVKVLVNNESPVEFDQPLFVVE
tara:strand:- start:3483 stop:3962 length:480 start_codon:yes stop_codon:yes gene_type:complete